MTSIIHVDPHELRQAAHSISEMAESLSSIADKLLYVTLGPRIYGGQLRGLTTNTGCELRGLAKKRVIRLREISALLIQLADGFEAVDQARLEGFVHIAGAMAAVAQESLVVPEIPVWLRRGVCPPWIDQTLWNYKYTDEYKSAILDQAQEYWAYLLRHSADMGGMDQEVMEEMLVILLLAHLGRNIDGRVADYPMLEREYGRGKTGQWEAHSDPDNPENATQYLDVWKLANLNLHRPYYHRNLCGELAVMAALHLDLKEGLRVFKDVIGWEPTDNEGEEWDLMSGEDILLNRKKTTSGYTLVNFFETVTEGALDASFEAGFVEPAAIANMLREGKSLVALVNIDTLESGQLGPLDQSNGPAAHWVTVLDVVEPPEGPKIVRVYNPYMNQEEFYTWDTFTDAWSQTRGNTTQYGLVVAEPTSGE